MDGQMTREEFEKALEEMRRKFLELEQCRIEFQSVRKRYEQLLQSAPDAMVFVDRDAKIVLVNAQLGGLFGYTVEELIDMDLDCLIPMRYRSRHRENVAGYFEQPRVRFMGSDLAICGVRKDGSEFPADISLSPLLEDHDIREIFDEVLKTWEERFRRQAIIVQKSYGGDTFVRVDRAQVQEAIGCIIENAVDAMPRGGTLSVITDTETVSGAPYVRVKLQDTGEGIPAEKIGKVFEPFFTTKVSPKGTGLGLPIAKRIMGGGRRHDHDQKHAGPWYHCHAPLPGHQKSVVRPLRAWIRADL